MRRLHLLATFAVLPLGCAAQETGYPTGPSSSAPSNDAAPAPTADDATAPPVDADAPADAAADAGPAGVALPFFVSDEFVPSGFMGDSQASIGAIAMSHDPSGCKSPRQPGAGGDCYTITWAPTPPAGGAAWAGVYWQSPSNNWGSKPGKPIAAGAQKVSFYAAGAVGGETIQACAGGINASGPMPTLPYGDTFTVKSQPITLTTTWTRYELSLAGASYSSVLGGFCWVASASGPMPTHATFYVDDLRWE